MLLDLIEVLLAGDAVNAQRDTGHDRLLLLDKHVGVSLYRLEVYVVLNTKRQPEQARPAEALAGHESY